MSPGLFDKVLFPIQRRGKEPKLAQKPLNMTRDTTKPFDGEEQIEKTLVSDPLKLYVEVEAGVRRDTRQVGGPALAREPGRDALGRSGCALRGASRLPWLPPRGLDDLKAIACNRGLWEDIGNGYISKRPKKKRTAAQIVEESGPDDTGRVRLRVNTMHAGPAPRIHYAENGPVDDSSARLTENPFTTKALQVAFLVIDPSGQYETGEPESGKTGSCCATNCTRMGTDGESSSSSRLKERSATRWTPANHVTEALHGSDRHRRRRRSRARVCERRRPRDGKRSQLRGQRRRRHSDRRHPPRVARVAVRAQARLAYVHVRRAQGGEGQGRELRESHADHRPGRADRIRHHRGGAGRRRSSPSFWRACSRSSRQTHPSR